MPISITSDHAAGVVASAQVVGAAHHNGVAPDDGLERGHVVPQYGRATQGLCRNVAGHGAAGILDAYMKAR